MIESEGEEEEEEKKTRRNRDGRKEMKERGRNDWKVIERNMKNNIIRGDR